MMAASASLTNFPSMAGQVVPRNFPAASTGIAKARLRARATTKSSAPNAARCTRPVPSSAVTKSAGTTSWRSPAGRGTTSSGSR